MTEPLPLIDEVRSGDHRRALVALRDTLALTIAIAEPSNIAALGAQLQRTLAELATLQDDAEVDPLDELAARRPDASRAPVQARAASGRKRRTASD